MGGTDAVFGTTGGGTDPNATSSGLDHTQDPELNYAPWEYANDIYNFSAPEATAPVLMSQGAPTFQNQPPANSRGYNYTGSIQQTSGTQNIMSLRQAMGWAQSLTPDKMSNFTSALYAAGFYPPTNYTKGGKPPNGRVFDDQAQYAALKLYSEVVKYNVANPNSPKSMSDILKERIDAGAGQSQLDQNAAQTKGQVYRVTTDDPATLRATVTKTAQAILGRAVTSQEQDALVEKMLAAEKAPQEAAITAGQTADTGSDVRLATAQVDAQSQLEEQLKAQHPDQAGAYQQLNYYNMMTKMMQGGGA